MEIGTRTVVIGEMVIGVERKTAIGVGDEQNRRREETEGVGERPEIRAEEGASGGG